MISDCGPELIWEFIREQERDGRAALERLLALRPGHGKAYPVAGEPFLSGPEWISFMARVAGSGKP